jgi:ankyrin repeat protein
MFGGIKKDPPPETTYATLSQHVRSGDAAALEASLRSLRHPAAALAWHADGRPPLLLLAAQRNDSVCIGTLLSARADVNASDEKGTTALYTAARCDGVGALETLLNFGADVNWRRGSGGTALYVAAQNGAVSCLSMLLAAGAKAELAKEGGFTPLMVSTMRGHAGCAAALLEAGALAEQRYDVADQWTATMLGAHLNQLGALRLLCSSRPASLSLVDSLGRTAYDIALAAGHGEAAALLADSAEAAAAQSELAEQGRMLEQLSRLAPHRADFEIEPEQGERIRALLQGAGGAISGGGISGGGILGGTIPERAISGGGISGGAVSGGGISGVFVSNGTMPGHAPAGSEAGPGELGPEATEHEAVEGPTIFSLASLLHAQCSLVAGALLPASHLATELCRFDAETGVWEEQLAQAGAAHDAAVAAVRGCAIGEEGAAAARRDAAREAYVRAMGGLRARYEERRARGARLVGLRARAREEVGGDAVVGGGGDVGMLGEGGGGGVVTREQNDGASGCPASNLVASSLSPALSHAVPILQGAVESFRSAHADTLAAVAALHSALATERDVARKFRSPLAEAVRACGAAVAAGAREAMGAEAEAEVEQLGVLATALVSQVGRTPTT